VLLTALLVGCTTVGPDYSRPEVPLPPAWRAPPVDAADIVNTAWWEAFGDPELSRLVGEAIDANKDLLIASYRVEHLAARLDVSRAEGAPRVGYNAVRERVRRSEEQPALLAFGREQTYNNYAVNLTVSWEIDIWGRLARANEAARAEMLAGEEARRAVMLNVVTGVADLYVQLLSLDRQLELARQALANRQDAAALLDARYKGGSGTLIEATRAQAVVNELQAALPPIERDIALAENALAALLGRNPGPVPRRSIDSLKLPPVPQGVPSDVLDRRPDVVAAEQTLIAANARIGVAKGQYFPTISLTSALGLGSDQLRWLMSRTARTGEIGAGLMGTLFDGGRIDGDVRAADAERKQMTEAYLQAIQNALREVDDALVSRSRSAELVTALGQRLKTLEDVSRLARQRFEGGQSTRSELLDAERQVLSARDAQAQGVRDQYAAVVSIYKAMGGGWMAGQDRARSPQPVAKNSEPETRP
jgi:multidrug efflux system outer membrane protein